MEIKKTVAMCEFEDVVAAYLYDELSLIERDRFESHLADCTSCTDEFAAISNARYSMFEWRKEEFDHLATPTIVIPDLAKAKAGEKAEIGWFGGLVATLSFARSPIVVATLLLVCLGVGFVAINLLRNDEIQTVAEITDLPPASQQIKEPSNVGPVFDNEIDQPQPQTISVPRKNAGQSRPVARRAVNNAPKRDRLRQLNARKPALNELNEEADESLRLADLFDEIGG